MSGPEISGPQAGDLGWLIGLHGRWYEENIGLGGLQFERTVAAIAISVAARLSSPRVSMLVARDGDGPLATISADGEDTDEAGRGHIRIFIAEPRAKGQGLGHRLVASALDSLRNGGSRGAYLDTFAGLDAARAIYLKAGFHLCAEGDGMTWGSAQREQRYELDF